MGQCAPPGYQSSHAAFLAVLLTCQSTENVGFRAYCAKNRHFRPLFAASCAGYSPLIAPNVTYIAAYCAKPAM
jgi:hypothetical protein